MKAATTILLAACLAACLGFAPSPAGVAPRLNRVASPTSRALVVPRRTTAPVAALGALPLRPLRTTPSVLSAPVKALTRAAWALVCSLLCAVLCVRPAHAAAALTTTSASGGSGLLKWAGLGAVAGGAYLINAKMGGGGDQPMAGALLETQPEARAVEAPAAPPMAAPAAPAAAAPAADLLEPVEPTAAPASDADFFAELNARMNTLAEERAAAEAAPPAPEEPPKADDSTDEWGTGNTAVLEPPRPSETKPDEKPTDLDLPLGFPIVDGDANEPMVPPPTPTLADQAQIEMLEKMFGGKGPSTPEE